MGYFDKKEFELKKEHIILMQHFCWSWDDCEFGAPAVDCKRPFGNSSVYSDIYEIFNPEAEVTLNDIYEDDELKYDHITDGYWELYRGLEHVMQILTDNLSEGIRPGWYEQEDPYGGKWKRVRDPEVKIK